MAERILVVEDSRTQAEALRLLLAGAGYEAEVANSGEEALDRAQHDPGFDLVLSDVIMPGMSGFDVTRELKERLGERCPPIILLTSLTNPADIVRGLEAGADNYVTKPYDAEHLLHRVRSVLEGRARDGGDEGPVDVKFLGESFHIAAGKRQVIDMMLSSFEELLRINEELSAARAEAEAANHSKMQFLANMSHDLRTPLNAITGYVDLLDMGVRGPVTEAQHEDLQRVKRSTRYLLSLINDLLNFAKLEAGSVEFELAETPLAELMGDLQAMVEPLVEQKEVQYAGLLSEPELRAWADREKLQQVLVNLVTNAIKFTPSGTITLRADVEDDTVRIEVKDTGVGIPEAKLASVFEPFVQVHRQADLNREGIGLGLAISRDLVRRMGGNLTVTSEVGVGTTFTITLPHSAPSTLAEP
ncbi:MAG TPA: hybrid sensor histidine kinase/response regulator [Longimicrobiaceae bacterium]|nr:hybrid sensor histidine kinase/response regulator [Longimicrobiaceae bacterium]